MQTRLATHFSTASSRSQSSNTTTGLLPPSSKVHAFKLERAAACATAFPAKVDPVNDIFRIFICDAMIAPVSRPPLRIDRMPSGTLWIPRQFPGIVYNDTGSLMAHPASFASLAITSAVRGDFSLVLMILALPAATEYWYQGG